MSHFETLIEVFILILFHTRELGGKHLKRKLAANYTLRTYTAFDYRYNIWMGGFTTTQKTNN